MSFWRMGVLFSSYACMLIWIELYIYSPLGESYPVNFSGNGWNRLIQKHHLKGIKVKGLDL